MQILDVVTINRMIVVSKYFIGVGKVLELERVIKNHLASVVLFNHNLLPHQERNLSCFLRCKIIDRDQLILNIFSQRACTYSGKLQVELAQLRHLNSRLTHEWKHLERQKGGISIRGGPGEMQLENDRRLLRLKITQVLLRLKRIENQRQQSRRRRIKIGIPTVSLVGYANAGKSTLFNVMTHESVCVAKELFSTIDPICRRIALQKGSDVVLIDTVGFIQNLPQDLLSSFKATLQETTQATLLLHVVDFSSENFTQNINIVNTILYSIKPSSTPVLLVMNKIDQFDQKVTPRIDRNSNGCPIRVWISAKNQIGISLLRQVLGELLPDNMVCHELRIPINSSLYHRLHRLRAINQCVMEESNIRLRIQLSSVEWQRLLKNNQSLLDYIV